MHQQPQASTPDEDVAGHGNRYGVVEPDPAPEDDVAGHGLTRVVEPDPAPEDDVKGHGVRTNH